MIQMITITLFFFGYLFVIWQLMKAPNNLDRPPPNVQRKTSVIFWLCTVIFLLVIDYSIITSVLLTSLLTYFYATRICRFKANSNALLTVIPDILDNSKAQIHLSNPADSFQRGHYVELLDLLGKLSAFGITQITLTSPMFYKDKALRGLGALERLTSPHWLVTGKSIHWVNHLWEIAVLANLRRTKANQTINSLSLTQWYQITLTLNRHASEKS
ncbi:hypothetical protein VIS19158_11503 [Vibrio scophthalmi LMG 19158]|uniref:Uncharacterized protein n=2 Tax=Vibrio scophthalmi TaxID=45658 RepID=F9RI88_9VIBR|nr:hypothetical protein VIS19158_11503 [Vibrio scophthalmi LMG 19158]